MKEEKRVITGFLVCLGFLGVIFIIRQFYGFNKNDEIYYLSMARRFVQGDGMLVDEWNNGQLFTFVILPFVSILTWILGGTAEIVLVTRISFLVFQAAAAMISFLLLRNRGPVAAVCGISFFVFAPFNISAFSYNTLALTFLFLIFSMLASGRQWGRSGWVLIGILTALAVLANPYLLFLYLGYGVACAVNSLWKRQREGIVCVNSFFWLTVGAGIILLLFLAFVGSRGDFGSILQNLSCIVNDAERQKPFWEKLMKYPIRMWRYYWPLICGVMICAALRLLDRKKRIPNIVYLGGMSFLTGVSLIYYGWFWDHVPMNFLQVPLSFLGLAAYDPHSEKQKAVFKYWYIPALCFTLLSHMAADTGILAVSSAFWLVSAASVYLIWEAVKDQKVLMKAAFFCVCGLLITATAWQRVTYVWGDAALPELTVQLQKGPLKGIYTTEENKKLYDETLADLDGLELTEENRLLVTGLMPWAYLYSDARVASHTTWEASIGDGLLKTYYELVGNLPDVVYIPYAEEEELQEENLEYFLDQGYERKEGQRGTILDIRESQDNGN